MKQPNVVFLFADQWRAQAVGYNHDQNVKTPAIDNLATESINFSNTISPCPICTPYRASLLTGQRPLTTGLFMNDLCLSNKAPSIAHAYTDAGYDTAYIGKWHLDGHGRAGYIPPERRQGFDYWKVLECTHDYNNSFYYEGDSSEIKKWDGYDAFTQTDDAITYMKNRENNDKPFLLMVSYGTPHNPYGTAPKKYMDMYPRESIKLQPNVFEGCEEQAREFLQGYYAHITALDDCVSKILEILDDLGIADNTLFVLTSDHGDSVMSHCNPDIGSVNKQRPYNESVRVPFLLRYPKLFSKKADTITTLFTAPDIMPTLLDLCHVEIPDTVEGESFAPILLGNKKIEREGVLIADYMPFADWRPARGGKEYRGVVTERYTYVRSLEGPWMLYDNKNDVYQLNNLVNKAEFSNLQLELDQTLNRLLDEQNDEFLSGKELCKKYNYPSLDKNNAVPFKN